MMHVTQMISAAARCDDARSKVSLYKYLQIPLEAEVQVGMLEYNIRTPSRHL